MSAEDSFKVEQDDHVAWLIMNRPAKRNAMGLAFFRSLREHMQRFDEDPEVRAVIIKGAGPSFTAGTDLAEAGALIGDGAADAREQLRRKIAALQADITSIEKCRKPLSRLYRMTSLVP